MPQHTPPLPKSESAPAPIAVGALGGSGTRIIAQLLIDAGVFMGGDLNNANDNLWYTLLFKRHDVLVEQRKTLDGHFDLFFQRMQGHVPRQPEVLELLRSLADADRPQHTADWLKARYESFVDLNSHSAGSHPSIAWGWKEPNTHILSERLLEYHPTLRYVHVVRNGLDMAYNRNQNQTEFWAPIFLGEDCQPSPKTTLKYWCSVHRRIQGISQAYPGRVLIVNYDKFCLHTEQEARRILTFAGLSMSDALLQDFSNSVHLPQSSGIFRTKNIEDLDPRDIAYVAALGFETA